MVLFQASLSALVEQFNIETEVFKWLGFFLEKFNLKNSENLLYNLLNIIIHGFKPLIFTGILGENETKN